MKYQYICNKVFTIAVNYKSIIDNTTPNLTTDIYLKRQKFHDIKKTKLEKFYFFCMIRVLTLCLLFAYS
jgi:hypothetical protein